MSRERETSGWKEALGREGWGVWSGIGIKGKGLGLDGSEGLWEWEGVFWWWISDVTSEPTQTQ